MCIRTEAKKPDYIWMSNLQKALNLTFKLGVVDCMHSQTNPLNGNVPVLENTLLISLLFIIKIQTKYNILYDIDSYWLDTTGKIWPGSQPERQISEILDGIGSSAIFRWSVSFYRFIAQLKTFICASMYDTIIL